MSATNRSDVRVDADNYATPAWCVHRLLDRVELPRGDWLDPCAGEGAIIKACDAWGVHAVRWRAFELRQECRPLLSAVTMASRYVNWLGMKPRTPRFDVILTNPPYSLAMEFVEQSIRHARTVAMLLRLNFVASHRRHAFFSKLMPDVYVLPNRPSFTGGGTDATEYAWFVWREAANRRRGRIEVLDDTPIEVRQQQMRNFIDADAHPNVVSRVRRVRATRDANADED